MSSVDIRCATAVCYLVLQDAVLIGSRLDASQEASTCRLAFYGRILKLLDPNDATAMQQIKIYKLKQKKGSIDRVTPDGLSAVCKGMFKKETNIGLFSGMKVGAAPWLLLLLVFSIRSHSKRPLTCGSVPVQSASHPPLPPQKKSDCRSCVWLHINCTLCVPSDVPSFCPCRMPLSTYAVYWSFCIHVLTQSFIIWWPAMYIKML